MTLMYFQSFNELIEMGGHGLYVWSAYIITVIIMIYLIILPFIKKNSIVGEIRSTEAIKNRLQKDTVRP